MVQGDVGSGGALHSGGFLEDTTVQWEWSSKTQSNFNQ